MQEKTWYYEKWVGRQAAFSPSRYVNTEAKVLQILQNSARKYVHVIHAE